MRSSTSDGSLRRIRTIQPSPYGSSFTFSGEPDRLSLTSVTSPLSGAITSDTAWTDSTSAYGWSFVIAVPTAGGSKKTTSPSWSWAYQVIPSVAVSPSMRAQSWSAWYLRSDG